MIPINAEMNLAVRVLDAMRPGAPRSEGGLTVIPIFGAAKAPEYLLASEAIAQGLMEIREIGGGDVPNVVIENRAHLPVLLIDGEHLEGAKQNRIINVSALIGARRRTILPVSCVEHGRWHYEAADRFTTSKDHSYPQLRRMQAEASAAAAGRERRPSQAAVWRDVASKHAEMDVTSRTGAMSDSYMRHRAVLATIERSFPAPKPGQTGVLACIGGEPLVLDSFDRPATFQKLWPRLVSGYAMDSLRVLPIAPPEDVADRFLDRARRGDFSLHDPVGIGSDVVIASPSVVGNALVCEGGVVHLSLFKRESERDSRESRTARPVSRRRMRSYFHS